MPDDLLSDAPAPAAAPAAAPAPAGAAAPPPAAVPAATTPPNVAALAPDPTKEFMKTLPQDLQQNASLSRYTTTESLARAYVNLERTLGSEKVPIPKDPNDQEAWDRYYVAGGRPPEPKAYQFQKPDRMPEGMVWDDNMEGWWRQAAFESGLSQRQAQKLVDQYRDRYAAQIDLGNKQVTSEIMNGKAVLQRDWGSEYETRRAIARAAFLDLPAVVQQRARDSGLARDPEYIKSLYAQRVALTGERQPRPPGESAEGSPDALRGRIASFRSQHDAALKDVSHPEHDLRLKELTDMHNRLFVEQPAA
jgi:hypothetical protein